VTKCRKGTKGDRSQGKEAHGERGGFGGVWGGGGCWWVFVGGWGGGWCHVSGGFKDCRWFFGGKLLEAAKIQYIKVEDKHRFKQISYWDECLKCLFIFRIFYLLSCGTCFEDLHKEKVVE